MKIKFHNKLSIFLIGMLLLASCQDAPLDVGIDILPEGDQLEVSVDTFAIRCLSVNYQFPSTYYGNSEVDTNNECPIGHVLDPYFGETYAQMFAGIRRGDNYYGNEAVSSNDIYTDCFLYLNIKDFLNTYGSDNKGDFEFNVLAYPLTKTQRYGSTSNGGVLSNYVVKADDYNFKTQLAESTGILDFIPELEVDNPIPIDSGFYLAVKLQDNFGKLLMDSLKTTSTSFLTNFPGFYLSAEQTSDYGGIKQIRFARSKIVVKYTRPGGSSKGTDTVLFASYPINSYQGFHRNNPISYPIQDILSDTSFERDHFYVQALDGVKGLIELSGFKKKKSELQGKVGINFAELVIPIGDTTAFDGQYFNWPKRLTIREVIEPGLLSARVQDDISASYFNGFYDSEKGVFRINITEYINNYLKDTDNNYNHKLYVFAATYSKAETSSTVELKYPGRIQLNSGINPAQKAFLKIIYTQN